MESNKKRFSIIIASYNIEKYIGEAIESVLNQNFSNFELIIIDDCSTDKTIQEIKKYKDEKIQVYTTKRNTGTAAGPRNVGLKYAKGDYILFLDGDDKLYNENVLTRIDNLIGEEEYDIIFFGYQDIGNSNRIRKYNKENSTKRERILCDVSFSVSSRCWNRRFIKSNNMKFIEGMYYEDEVFCTKANILAEKTTYGGFPIFNYRRNRKGSVMSTPSVKKCSDWYRMLGEIVDMYEFTPEEYKGYLLSFIKNETDNVLLKIRAILKSLKENTGTPVFPKRNYEYVDFMEFDKEGYKEHETEGSI